MKHTKPTLGAGKGASLGQAAFEALLESIVSLELEPFQRLSEASMSEMLGLGRTPVREALVRLESLGFVEIQPQRGSVVAPLRLRDLEQSQFIRETLEVGLLRRAMQNSDHIQLARKLKNEVILQGAYLEIDDKAAFLASDSAFHGLIATAAGLGGVTQEIARTRAHMDRFRQLNVNWGDDLKQVRKQHEDIADAIEQGDADKAEAMLLTHLRRVYVYLEALHDSFPQYFETPSG